MGYFGTVKARVCIQNVSLQSEYLGTQIFFAFFQGDRKLQKLLLQTISSCIFRFRFLKESSLLSVPTVSLQKLRREKKSLRKLSGGVLLLSPRKQCFICSLIWIKSLGKLLRACCCCPSKTKPNYICCKKSYLQDITFTKYHIGKILYFQNIIFTRYYIYKISY